jgi:hypothetical protein
MKTFNDDGFTFAIDDFWYYYGGESSIFMVCNNIFSVYIFIPSDRY